MKSLIKKIGKYLPCCGFEDFYGEELQGIGTCTKFSKTLQLCGISIFFISLPISINGLDIGIGLLLAGSFLLLLNGQLFSHNSKRSKTLFFSICFSLFLIFAFILVTSFSIHWLQISQWWAGFSSRSFRIVGFLLFTFFLTFTPVKRVFTRLFPLFIFAAFLSSLYSIFTQKGRSLGFFSNPVIYSFVLSIVIFFVLFAFTRKLKEFKNQKVAAYLIFIVLIAVLYDGYLNQGRALLVTGQISLILLLMYFFPYKKILFPALFLIFILPFLFKNPIRERVEKNLFIFRKVDPVLSPHFEKKSSNQFHLKVKNISPENIEVSLLNFNHGSRADKLKIVGDDKKFWDLEFPNDKISTLCIDFSNSERTERWLYQIDPSKNSIPELFDAEALIKPSFTDFLQPWHLKIILDPFRHATWYNARALADNRPFIGYGPCSFLQASLNINNSKYAHVYSTENALYAFPWHPHSNFWSVAVETGYPSAILYILFSLFLILFTLLNWWKNPLTMNSFAFLALGTFIINNVIGIVELTIFNNLGGYIYWGSAALLLQELRIPNNHSFVSNRTNGQRAFMSKLIRFRTYILDNLRKGKMVFIGKPIFKTAIFFELKLQQLIDVFCKVDVKKQSFLNKELTIILKTFERPGVVKRFINSIRKFYPEIPIVLVDDSKVPTHIDGIETIEMPYDIGVSAGRNKALELVKTEFLLLVDDDFVFCTGTDLIKPLEKMKAKPKIDIMGGKVINLPFYTSIDYAKERIFPTDSNPIMPPGSHIDGMPVLDKVANFYIGRTESIRKVAWDDRIKRLDHADFFTRAKGVLVTVANYEFKCLHAPTIFDKKYMAIRNDAESDMHVLNTKYHN